MHHRQYSMCAKLNNLSCRRLRPHVPAKHPKRFELCLVEPGPKSNWFSDSAYACILYVMSARPALSCLCTRVRTLRSLC